MSQSRLFQNFQSGSSLKTALRTWELEPTPCPRLHESTCDCDGPVKPICTVSHRVRRDVRLGKAREVEGSSPCRRNRFSGGSHGSHLERELQFHRWMAWVTTDKTTLTLVDSNGLREDHGKERQTNPWVRQKWTQGPWSSQRPREWQDEEPGAWGFWEGASLCGGPPSFWARRQRFPQQSFKLLKSDN